MTFHLFPEGDEKHRLVEQEQYMGLTLSVYRWDRRPNLEIACNGYITGEMVREAALLSVGENDLISFIAEQELTYYNWTKYDFSKSCITSPTGKAEVGYKTIVELEHYTCGFDHFHAWDMNSGLANDSIHVLAECRMVAKEIHEYVRLNKPKGFDNE